MTVNGLSTLADVLAEWAPGFGTTFSELAMIGTVVEVLERACKVEFTTGEGQTFALSAVPSGQLLVLRFERNAVEPE